MYNSPFKHPLLLFAIFVILSSSACRTKKGDGTGVIKDKSAKFLVKKLDQNKIEVDWLSAKAKVDFQSKDLSIGATAYIRMQKDSAIWIVGKKFGFEAVRVLITRDSVFALDRLNSEYRATDLSFIQNQFSLPVQFDDLQNMLLGNMVLLPNADALSAEIDQKQYHLSEKKQQSISKDYWLNAYTFSPERMMFQQGSQNRDALIEYSDHIKTENAGLLAHHLYLSFASPETGPVLLDIKYSKVEIDIPQNMPFEVPGHYELVD